MTVFEVALDDVAVAWLLEVAQGCGIPPAQVIAAMLRDIREDDEANPDTTHVLPRIGMSLN